MDNNFGQVPSQAAKDSRDADKEDRQRADLFAVMIQTDAWKEYIGILEARIEAQGRIVLNPAGSVDGAMVCEYEKGTMRGFIIARDLPQITIGIAKSLTSAPDTDEN